MDKKHVTPKSLQRVLRYYRELEEETAAIEQARAEERRQAGVVRGQAVSRRPQPVGEPLWMISNDN